MKEKRLYYSATFNLPKNTTDNQIFVFALEHGCVSYLLSENEKSNEYGFMSRNYDHILELCDQLCDHDENAQSKISTESITIH